MRSRSVLVIVIAVLALLAIPASAARPGGGGLMPRPNPEWEMRKRLAADETVKSPYPRTYSEQVVQSLGLRKDGVRLFEPRDHARNPYAPSVSLGGTMLRLRWQQ
ncbi:MAG TPA: hypothetical protein VJ798_11095 [Rhizomicrobium sp.]|nr:hypothetical protein [Rhizomicrobium sp.]